MYPLQGEEILLFKTSISFIDHLQEFLGAILTACPLVIPPFSELKDNMFSVVDFLQVCFHIEDSTIYRTYNSRIFFFIAHL
jgi:acyl-CoA synthetase